MTTILYLTDPDRDYAADFLYHGFCRLLGPKNVIDWPPKESLHGRWVGARDVFGSDEPVFDCDLSEPRHGWLGREVDEALATRSFDLIVVPTLRPRVRFYLGTYRSDDLLTRNRDRIVAYDGEDSAERSDHYFADALGFYPAAMFKRELPIGETWAKPLPFGYPVERVVPATPRDPRVGYLVELWDWARGGMREKLYNALMTLPAEQRDVAVSRDGQGRISVKEYHARMRQCSIAVVPAGRGYWTNRHLDVVADGCCPLYERRTVQGVGLITLRFGDHTPAAYFDYPEEAMADVRELIGNPQLAYECALSAQQRMIAHHTTERRAELVWRAVHKELPVRAPRTDALQAGTC